MKAFLVDCDGEYGAQVYFAETRGQAKVQAANEEDADITGVVSCKRKPEWDQYSPGPVPVEVLIAAGWWFECSGCSQHVTEDGECWHGDEPCDSGPVFARGLVWCCQGCRDSADARDREREAEEARKAADALRSFEAKFAGVADARVIDRYGGPSIVQFNIPGGTSHVLWRVGSEFVEVSPVDLPAWNSWEDSRMGPVRTWEDDGGAVSVSC